MISASSSGRDSLAAVAVGPPPDMAAWAGQGRSHRLFPGSSVPAPVGRGWAPAQVRCAADRLSRGTPPAHRPGGPRGRAPASAAPAAAPARARRRRAIRSPESAQALVRGRGRHRLAPCGPGVAAPRGGESRPGSSPSAPGLRAPVRAKVRAHRGAAQQRRWPAARPAARAHRAAGARTRPDRVVPPRSLGRSRPGASSEHPGPRRRPAHGEAAGSPRVARSRPPPAGDRRTARPRAGRSGPARWSAPGAMPAMPADGFRPAQPGRLNRQPAAVRAHQIAAMPRPRSHRR